MWKLTTAHTLHMQSVERLITTLSLEDGATRKDTDAGMALLPPGALLATPLLPEDALPQSVFAGRDEDLEPLDPRESTTWTQTMSAVSVWAW